MQIRNILNASETYDNIIHSTFITKIQRLSTYYGKDRFYELFNLADKSHHLSYWYT